MVYPEQIKAVVEPLIPEFEAKHNVDGEWSYSYERDEGGDPCIVVTVRGNSEGMTKEDVRTVVDTVRQALFDAKLGPNLFPYVWFLEEVRDEQVATAE